MPADGAPAGLAVHASAVAIGQRALLILGRSGAGKSRLAAALVRASRPNRSIALVGDDRILLSPGLGGLEARPHPRIAGFIERRGLGLVAVPWRERAIVGGVAILGRDAAPVAAWAENLPTLRLVGSDEDTGADAVLVWWRTATSKRHRLAHVHALQSQDWNW